MIDIDDDDFEVGSDPFNQHPHRPSSGSRLQFSSSSSCPLDVGPCSKCTSLYTCTETGGVSLGHLQWQHRGLLQRGVEAYFFRGRAMIEHKRDGPDSIILNSPFRAVFFFPLKSLSSLPFGFSLSTERTVPGFSNLCPPPIDRLLSPFVSLLKSNSPLGNGLCLLLVLEEEKFSLWAWPSKEINVVRTRRSSLQMTIDKEHTQTEMTARRDVVNANCGRGFAKRLERFY